MPGLRDLQAAFMAALQDPSSDSLDSLVRNSGLAPNRRIAVYRNNRLASLVESLEATYPAICALVGEKFFGMLARRHIQHYPSRSGDLHRFGAEFVDTVTASPEASGLPYLADIARLEWSYHRVFHAAEREPIAVTALKQVDTDQQHRVVLAYHPASALVQSRWPILDIWQLAIHDTPSGARVDLDQGGQALLVARRRLEMGFQPLDATEYRFVQALRTSLPLGQCFEMAHEVDENSDPVAILGRQFALGNIVGFTV